MPRRDQHPIRRPAIITGASSGIGASLAEMMAAAGFPVILGARRVDRLEGLARSINDAGGEAYAFALDLSQPPSITEFVAAATAAVGEVEILVSNAGDVRPLGTVESPPAEFARQLAVNLAGAQQLVYELVPDMIARHRGDVVFVTSEVAVRPRTHMAGYVASKAGLEGFADAMAMECEGTGVRIGMVRPGPSSTEQGATWEADQVHRAIASWQNWGLLRHSGVLQPSDVAAAVLAMVQVPRGARFALVEVQPEAPIDLNSVEAFAVKGTP